MTATNIIIKCILLGGAVAAAVAGILHYKQTILDPPQSFHFTNIHDVELQQSIEAISAESLMPSFLDVYHKWARLYDEDLIGSDTRDVRQKEMLSAFTPLFINRCNKAFSASVWDQPDWSHSFMNYMVGWVLGQTDLNGMHVIPKSSEYAEKLTNIQQTIQEYNNAWAMATATTYKSISTTKAKEAQAEKYKEEVPLKNCTSLVEALNMFPSKLRASHLSHIENMVNGLHCSDINFYTDFSINLKFAWNSISQYEEYYHTVDDTNELKQCVVEKTYNTLIAFVDYSNNYSNFSQYIHYESYRNRLAQYINDAMLHSNDKRELQRKLLNYSNMEFDLIKKYGTKGSLF